MRTPRAFYNDHPTWPVVLTEITYWGITSAAGAVTGTTVVCQDLVNEPSYQGLAVKLLDGAAAGQVRVINVHVAGTNTLTVPNPFTDNAGAVVQVTASIRFVIMSLGGGGGAPAPPVAPSIGLWMFGMCDPGMAASLNTLVMPNLAGFPNDIFNNEFWIQVIYNANAPGVVPERQIRRVTNYVGATGTFTVDPFGANVEANDLVAVFHESIMSIEILGFGTLDASSVTVPADSTRPEAAGHFDGCLLMTTEGAVAFQPRRIVDFTAAGVFTLDPNYPFTALPGLVDYIIIGDQDGYEWPYIHATMSCLEQPRVGQPDMEVARLSLHNLRPDGAIPAAEYANTTINIDRMRLGVDADWVNIVAGAAMVEQVGWAEYDYTFPAVSWQDGDLIRYTIYDCTVTIPPGSVQVFTIPRQTRYGVVGGLGAVIELVEAIFDLVNAILITSETGGTVTTDGTEQDIYINNAPAGVYEPLKVMIDFSNQTQAETVIIRTYYRIVNGGALVLKDELEFSEEQDPPLKNVELEPNRFGIRVSIQRIAGAAIAYPWEVLFRA